MRINISIFQNSVIFSRTLATKTYYRFPRSMRFQHSQNVEQAKLTVDPKIADSFLRSGQLQFNTSDGQTIDVEAVFQDTMPSGCGLGTVLAIHGSPGSHKDFKYVMPLLKEKGIRFIGVNMPGYGFTPGDPLLRYDNVERDNFVHELIARIGNLERLVVIGHSRGTENATGVAARNVDKLAALVLLNPTGLSHHRVMRLPWLIPFVLWLYSLGSTAQRIIHVFLKFLYNSVMGLRLDSGERAVICVKTMHNLEYAKGMLPNISTINQSPNVRVLIAYSGKDLFIETSVSEELVAAFDDCIEINCEDKGASLEDNAIQQTRELFLSGAKAVSIHFKEDGHFLQRDRARYLANSIEAILQAYPASSSLNTNRLDVRES